MGEINDKLCNLLGKPEYFADFWNGSVWTLGQKVEAELLSRDDKEYYKFLLKSSGIRRDVLMKVRGKYAAKLGIELMEKIDYTIPARIMDYDAQELKRQLNDIAVKNRRQVELEQISWEHGGEFLYGVRLQDRILPVQTVALYCGWEEYDGACSTLAMCDTMDVPKMYKEQFGDYTLQLYSLRNLEEERFETGLRELVAVFKRCKDKATMKEYYEANRERFRQLDNAVIEAMGALIGRAKLKMFKQEGRGLDLCKAFEDEREEGREEERIRLSKMIELLYRDGRSDDVLKAATDMVYQKEVLAAYGLL